MEPKNPEVGDIEIRLGTALICITSLRGLARHEGTYVVSSYGSDFKSVTKNMKEDPSGDPSDGSKLKKGGFLKPLDLEP